MNMLWYFLVVLGQIGLLVGTIAVFVFLVVVLATALDEAEFGVATCALATIVALAAFCFAFFGTAMGALDDVRIRHKDSYNECIEERTVDGDVKPYAYEHCLEDNEGISY